MQGCCSCSQTHIIGTCTCAMFNSNYSMLFSNKPYNNQHDYELFDDYSSYTSSSSSSSSSVDCTLSLGTPSTRLTEDQEKRTRRSSLSNFCWNNNNNNNNNSSSHSKHNSQSQTKSNRGNNIGNSNNDSLLARRCANCDTTSTPLWRNGPRGPKSLCNACGIRYKKEERRANAAVATSAGTNGSIMESGHVYSNQNNSWYAHPQSQMFGIVDDSDGDSENGIPFLSWRLNTSLVHDYTR